MPYADREKQLAFQRKDKQRQREERKNLLFKDAKCMGCGNTDLRVLDFHHRDPSQRKFRVTMILTYNWNTIMEEVVKCDILCANCHRIRHVMGL